MRALACFICGLGLLFCSAQNADIQFEGLRIFVKDLDQAEKFYSQTLGFSVRERSKGVTELATNAWPIYLQGTSSAFTGNYPGAARTGLTIQTYKLLPQVDQLRAAGVPFYDSLLTRNGVGISIPFQDPSGNVLSLMEVQVQQVNSFQGVQIYNCGVTIAEMESAIQFYEHTLGFEEWSRNYLPNALPLKHRDGSFAFMIHYKEGLARNNTEYGQSSHLTLLLSSSDLNGTKDQLRKKKIPFRTNEDTIFCQDPEGNHLEIKQRT